MEEVVGHSKLQQEPTTVVGEGAPIALVWGLLFSAAVTWAIYYLGHRLQRFEKAEKKSVFFYKWTSPRPAEALAHSPLTGIKQCPWPLFAARSAWLMYGAHQLFAWVCVYLQQRFLSEQPFAFYEGICDPLQPLANVSDPLQQYQCGYSNALHWTHWLTLAGHAFFILLHLVQTHIWYDGTALDMGENTSQISVIFMLVFVLFMENHERGLFMGARLPVAAVVGNFAKKYHGYLFSWSAIYTFWYHPCESTSGHLAGFFYTYLILLHGGLAFTNVHLWPRLRVFVEVFVAFHAACVAYFVQLHKTLWRMFLFGFLFVFVCTQMWGDGIFAERNAADEGANGGATMSTSLGRAIFAALYVSVVALTYWYHGARPHEVTEIIRTPTIEYALTFLVWLICSLSYGFARLCSDQDPGLGGWGAAVAAGTMVTSFILLTWGMSEGIEALQRKKARRSGTAKEALLEGSSEGAIETHTLNEVAQHATRDDCWIIVEGQVLDVTQWLEKHPGGASVLLERAGTDCTAAFKAARHSTRAENILTKMLVGHVLASPPYDAIRRS